MQRVRKSAEQYRSRRLPETPCPGPEFPLTTSTTGQYIPLYSTEKIVRDARGRSVRQSPPVIPLQAADRATFDAPPRTRMRPSREEPRRGRTPRLAPAPRPRI